MGRQNLVPQKERTTIILDKTLMDRMSHHVLSEGDNQTNFISRAIINQLEKEGDLEIRDLIEAEKEEEE